MAKLRDSINAADTWVRLTPSLVCKRKKPLEGGSYVSNVMTFIDHCLAGAATLDEIDDYVERWHDGTIGHGMELRELLGMSKQEYARWMQDASAIEEIIAARKNNFRPIKS